MSNSSPKAASPLLWSGRLLNYILHNIHALYSIQFILFIYLFLGLKVVKMPSLTMLEDFCTHHGLTTNDINKEVSEKHILEIYARMINPVLVANHLCLSKADIESIELRARDSMKLMRLYVLQDWKEMGSLDETATYGVLLEALLNSGNSKTALEISKLLSHK